MVEVIVCGLEKRFSFHGQERRKYLKFRPEMGDEPSCDLVCDMN
jgi:hypothetical protein